MSRFLGRSKHCAPVAPDKPVDPVRPLRPVSPVAPVRPDDPVRPLRPVCPELPARQPPTCEADCCLCRRVCCIESKSLCPIHACQDSWGEASPCAPVAPDNDPVRPLRPVCPELPARQPPTCEAECCHCRRVCCMKSKSLCPIYACQDSWGEASTCAPVAPDKPVDPVRPLRPVSPVAPVRPDDPVRPLRPVCPELPARQPSTCETECCHCRRVCCIESKSLCPIYACQDYWGEASTAHLWRPTSLWMIL